MTCEVLAVNSDQSTGVIIKDEFTKAREDTTVAQREVFYTIAKNGLVDDFKAEVARLAKANKFFAFEKE